MKKTENYRSHHEQIRVILSDIKRGLDLDAVTQQPENITVHIRQLFGKFSTHLALEDRAFYPRAIANDNVALSSTARKFQEEMGGLGELFHAYRQKWPGPLAISKSPADFITETNNIISLLEKRLEREEGELYALYDRYA
ncbi:hypothetical protein GCM10011332_03840 [Terasakiella brassicae]|uniref:Hemerythrin-like domain-containing protein n=1 Tax=Terasakiella brassicae TaxID=1634917 RepID=A0A917F8P7_9PROT|nr:hemerythrin domain-containing protein [Terasakiella brassicae]GGF53729.1 hypothetical protein GCM10011332_03840 [Terasakiella brassicae]